jgi:hypothetical protein
MRRFLREALLLAALAIAGPAAHAQGQPSGLESARTFLFVGNSFFYYNNSMHSLFLDIARAADGANAKSYRAVSATISGSGLNWHDMEGYFGKGMASYSFDPDNRVVFNSFDKPFDAVIMNDCSQCPVHPQLSGLFKEYVKKHGETVRRHGAIPVLFMTWAYQDKPEMTQQLADAYTEQGKANGMPVVAAGLAFAKAIERRPDLVLYQKDKRHPTLAGTYLGAATAYAAIYRKSPVGNPATGGLDPELAAFLQGVAWDTVQAYANGKS